MDIKWMLAYIFMSMETAKHEKEARLVRKNQWSHAICRATHRIRLSKGIFAGDERYGY